MSNSDSSTPAIRGFQFDSGAVGNLKNSVNLFRGDVNFHQKLLSLTARPGKQELDVNLSIQYQSNIHDQTQKWNREAATGVLGLGWSLPIEQIEMNESAALSASTKSYYYSTNGSKNPLIRELGMNPYRFTMNNSYTPQTGQAIGTEIQAQFENNAILIDANSMVSTLTNTSWLITDSINQQLFEIKSADNKLQVYDGGESYQLQNYSFWKILYYPKFERWLIVKESGTCYSFGGYNSSINKNKNGYKTSAGNSVQWAVCWVDSSPENKPIWKGSSSLTNRQMQYAKSWSLNTIQDRFGDQVSYNYNEFGVDGTYSSYSNSWRDETAELIPIVEQQVGSGGLPYTKAHYITSIIDSFGRKVIFNYGDKKYTKFTNSSNASQAREYLDPHRDLSQQVIADQPNTWPQANAYQDNYETKFLENIQVQSSLSQLLFSIVFSFDEVTHSYAGYADDNHLFGDTVKRQLVGVTQLNEFGESLLEADQAELIFQYSSTSDQNPGALQTIKYPNGATARYNYDQVDLDVCDRKITITPPAVMGSSSSPKVFYGQDYVVSLWTNPSLTKLSMRVYTWLGHWQLWELCDEINGSLIYDNPNGSIHVNGGSGNLLNVKTAENYFVVSFSDGLQVQAYSFSKDTSQPGQWIPFQANDEGNSSQSNTACNSASITWPASSNVTIYNGGSWFLSLEKKSNQLSTMTRYTNRWAQQQGSGWIRNNWTIEPLITNTSDTIYIATTSECYFILNYSNSSLTATTSLEWLSPQLDWNHGATKTFQNFRLAQTDNALAIAGQSFVVFSNQTSNPTSSKVFYDVRVFQWNSEYEFIDSKWDGGMTSTTTALSLQDQIGRNQATPSFIANVVSNSLFACAGNIFRFDGQTWWSRTANNGLPVNQNASYLHFAYGEDYAIQGWVDNTTPKGNLIAYDPNQTGAWNASEVTVDGLPNSTPAYDPSNSNWVTSGNSDFLSNGSNIYYRGSSADWSSQVEQLGYKITSADNYQVNTAALSNQAPSFISYFEYKQGALASSTVGALLLKNGEVYNTQSFVGERYYTSLENSGSGFPGNGLNPAGPNSLVTYPDSEAGFQKTQTVFLYRYAGQGLTGAITHRPVISIEVDDGFGNLISTAYEYDPSSAACDVSGNVIKYYKVNSYPGCAHPTNQKNGYKNQQYINGLVSLVISQIKNNSVISWNDGGGDKSYRSTKDNDSLTINNVTTAILQSMTLSTPTPETLDFLYGTSEFSNSYNQVNNPQPMFSTLPQAPINFFQMLDGVLWRSFTYKTTESGFQEIASQLNTWQPYTHRSGDLVDPNQADLPLKGGLILQLIKQNETDGTLKTEQTNYIPEGFTAPTTGQAFTKSINYVDGNAESIELIETSTYAYQVYSSFRSLHNYTATVQKRTTHNELLTAATADTFALSINNNAVTVPFKSASFKFATGDFQPFPFSSYDSLNPATWNGWLRTNLIAASQPNGLVLNSQDASGVNHSILYDKDFKFSVGSVSNAYFEAPSTANIFHLSNNLSSQAAYTGFEGYEDMNGWILANGALVDLANDDMVSDCHTGDQSLRLPNMGQLIRSITVKGNPQTYLVGFWYKTSADYSEGGLQVSITPSLSTTPDNLRFSNTSGDWVYQSIAVMLNDDANELSICWQNNASSEVRIDDVFIMPMSAELGTHIYDSKFNYVTATNESSGRTSRMLRNRFHQFTSNISFNDQVTDLSVSFCSRQQDNDFNQDTPNAKITLKAATSGVFANFKSGGSYAQNFEFSLLQSHWQVQGDSILHNIAENDTITTPPVEPTQSLAFYLEISSCNQTQINQPFNITVGDYQFTWTPAAKHWSGSGPTSISTVVQKNTPRNILLMRGHGVVVLFADGLFIGSYTESVSGDRIVFSTGNNQMAISNLMILTNPRLKLDYYDASSKVIQTQLLMGQDSYVSQAIHDDVGRDNVVFKAIPFSFQNTHGPNNSAQQVLSYRKGLFNVQEFVTSLQGSGVLNGDIADFYTGNSTKVQQWQTLVSSWNNPTNYSFIPTNDSGYPYSRKRYEASPLARVVEKGQPGTLNDGSLLGIDLTQNATDRKTLQYEFGLNDSEFVLPDLFARNASSYSIISELSPLKSRKVQLKDQQDNLVSTLIYDANTINPRQYNQQFQNYTDSGYSQIIRTPNYFSSDSNRQSTNFQTLLNYDLLGQVSSSHEADTGNTLYMYDSLGRLRFELPDQTSQTNSFIKYTCYNQLSQVVRNGTLDASTFPWSSLALHVDDQSWPSAENSKETRRLSYNDYGTQDSGPSASQLGQVTQVITNNYRTINADSIIIEVKEQFDYDLSAAIVATTQIITEINATSQTIIGSESGYMVEYSYNNLQQLSSISYPSEYGQNLKYSYDELGREKNQQYGDNNGILADYQYGTGDHPSNMSVSVKQEQSIIKQISSVNYNYISPDLLASGSNQNNQNIGTNVGEYEYNANSNIKSETIIFELLKASDMQNYSYQLNKDLNYDESVNRLISSVDSSNPDTNVTDVSYDNNGNIQNLNQANSRINWEFKDNNIIGQRSDLLSAISTSTIEILNNDSGQMLQAPNNAQTSTANTISYDESLGVVASIDIGSSSQVTYAYGSQGQRVLKRSDANSQATRVIYVSPGSHNLSEITIGAENQLLNYIYGQANSLIGVTVGTDIRFPISDQKGTVLAWLNSDSQVLSAYKFLPFGELIVKDDSSSSNPIIYAGQPYEEDIGLYNFRGRFYDPVLRRFISPDPQRQFPSPFVYAGNNPIVNIDPSGEMSKDAIGGLILSIAEIGLAIGTGSFWAIPIGVAGLTNTISHKNDSGKAFWKNYAYSEVGTAIGIAEITAGVALTVLTDGAAGSWGGATLIGAGVSAISYSTFHEGDFSWNAYAKAQVVGAVGGFITGGFGAAAGALTLTGGTLVAAEIGLGITAGVTSSLSSSLISAAWDHQSINWKSALINAGISGALGVAGVGAGRLAKGAFGKVANDIEAEVNPIANERTALNPPDKVTGWKKFVYGENETVFNRNSAGNIIPNPARITNLAKPIVFNSKKPVISAVNDYDPNSKEWV